jgi:hypothetical protein
MKEGTIGAVLTCSPPLNSQFQGFGAEIGFSLRKMIFLLTLVFLSGIPSLVLGAIAPAAGTVSAADFLFPFEKIQLTEAILANLSRHLHTSNSVQHLSFAKYTLPGRADGAQTRKKCKTYPDDADWPSPADLETFGDLLGGNALIKTVPEASVCFSGDGTVVGNSTECQALTAGWGNSTLRYATTSTNTQ